MIDIHARGQLIEIGRERENEYRRVLFDMADVLGQYPDATFLVLHRRSADSSAYAVPASQISTEGTSVCWVLTAADLAYIGEGECEVVAYSGNTVAKDEIYSVRVLAALDEGMDPPDPSWDEYLADLSAIADRAETAGSGAEENALKAEGYAIGRQNGVPVDQESPYYHGNAAYFAGEAGVSAATAAGSAGEAAGSASAAGRSAGSAAGSAAAAETAQIKAETAQDAAEAAQEAAERARDEITGMTAEATTLDPGESATASYSDGVLTIGIPRGADGQDGKDGQDGRDGTDGKDGKDGADGISPEASVSKNGKTATITITDKTGTTTAQISDGEDGQDGAPGQDGYTPVRGIDYWTAADQAAIVADAVAEIEPEVAQLRSEIDGKAPVINRDASGDIVSFADGADGMPLSAVVQIDPVQAGSGDPSPENIRSISGHDSCRIAVVGTQTADGGISFSYTQSGTGDPSTSNIRPIIPGLSIVRDDSSTLTLYAGTINPATGIVTEAWRLSTPDFTGGSWNLSGTSSWWRNYSSKERGSSTAVCSHFTTTTYTSSDRIQVNSTGFSAQSDLVAYQVAQTAAGTPVQIVYKLGTPATYQLSPEETQRALTALGISGSVYPISWQTAAGTVYGGRFDTATGVLTVTDGQIAAYAGETLPGAWISDRDVYTPGGTPTTGAQVVYKLSEPVTYQLDPVQMTTLLGLNNIWADTGAISVEYAADTKTYIAKVTDPDANVVTVTGSTPSITGESGKRYVCGTVDSISITPPGTGIIDVVFTSGTTPAVLTVPNTVKFPAWFNPLSLDASTTYEINIADGKYGAVMAWT